MNLYNRFKTIFPDPPLQVGTVVSVSGGVATVSLPSGGLITARGNASNGQSVFVRDGVIEGTAPSLTIETIEV